MKSKWESEEGRKLLLGALLHDIGKLLHRAKGPTKTHQEYGEEFIGRLFPGVKNIIAYHHSPEEAPDERYLVHTVALADRLSAGERLTDEAPEEKGLQLLSPFCLLDEDPERLSRRSYFPLSPLSINTDQLFPTPQPENDPRGLYEQTVQRFEEALTRLAHLDFPAFLESLLYLLQRLTWCIPSAYWKSLPDVSLYDHLRTTAAIAAALYRLSDVGGRPPAEAIEELCLNPDSPLAGEPFMSLLYGDVSGLQDFLYSITARGAAKGLKGRSFYLQLLPEVVARWILRELELPPTNLLYCGGGHFALITQLLDEGELDRLRCEVNRRLFKLHRGDLYIALGAAKVSFDDLWRRSEEGFSRVWREAAAAAAEDKSRRFASLPPQELRQVFEPRGSGTGTDFCAACGREPAPILQEGVRLCRFCQSLIELGGGLRHAEYLLLEEVMEERGVSDQAPWDEGLGLFGFLPRVFTHDDLMKHLSGSRKGLLLSLGDPDFLIRSGLLNVLEKQRELALGFRYFAVATPDADGRIAEFSDMANVSQGVKRLGLLRMDVDNLGKVFGERLPPKARTLSRFATLSFLLSLYFEGEVARLCRNYTKGEELAYLIYSGGDDLFLVGSWSLIPKLALEIREGVGRFFGGKLTVSAGIALEEEKFPLYHGAEDAKEALEKAKRFKHPDGREKDAVAFLETSGWEEFKKVKELAEDLKSLVTEGRTPRALLQLLQRLGQEAGVKSKPRYGRWHWLAAYTLTRTIEMAPSESKERLERIRSELVEDLEVKPYAYAARWAELLTRITGE